MIIQDKGNQFDQHNSEFREQVEPLMRAFELENGIKFLSTVAAVTFLGLTFFKNSPFSVSFCLIFTVMCVPALFFSAFHIFSKMWLKFITHDQIKFKEAAVAYRLYDIEIDHFESQTADNADLKNLSLIQEYFPHENAQIEDTHSEDLIKSATVFDQQVNNAEKDQQERVESAEDKISEINVAEDHHEQMHQSRITRNQKLRQGEYL